MDKAHNPPLILEYDPDREPTRKVHYYLDGVKVVPPVELNDLLNVELILTGLYADVLGIIETGSS